jgi:methyl-accepting chemotaxis protein
MSEQQTFLSRVGSWFRKPSRESELPLAQDSQQVLDNRSTFLRPWAGQRAAIQRLQESFDTLTDLMGSVRENMESQAKRQDELLAYLSHLPEALRAIPEGSRMHAETLKTIQGQLEQQNLRAEKVASILEKMHESGGEQREAVQEIREQMENIRATDETITSNLSNLGSALQSVSHNSSTSAQVLEQMRDRIDSRDNQLEKLLHRQGVRFTTMLAFAIFISVAALAIVAVMAYLMINKQP